MITTENLWSKHNPVWIKQTFHGGQTSQFNCNRHFIMDIHPSLITTYILGWTHTQFKYNSGGTDLWRVDKVKWAEIIWFLWYFREIEIFEIFYQQNCWKRQSQRDIFTNKRQIQFTTYCSAWSRLKSRLRLKRNTKLHTPPPHPNILFMQNWLMSTPHPHKTIFSGPICFDFKCNIKLGLVITLKSLIFKSRDFCYCCNSIT